MKFIKKYEKYQNDLFNQSRIDILKIYESLKEEYSEYFMNNYSMPTYIEITIKFKKELWYFRIKNVKEELLNKISDTTILSKIDKTKDRIKIICYKTFTNGGNPKLVGPNTYSQSFDYENLEDIQNIIPKLKQIIIDKIEEVKSTEDAEDLGLLYQEGHKYLFFDKKKKKNDLKKIQFKSQKLTSKLIEDLKKICFEEKEYQIYSDLYGTSNHYGYVLTSKTVNMKIYVCDQGLSWYLVKEYKNDIDINEYHSDAVMIFDILKDKDYQKYILEETPDKIKIIWDHLSKGDQEKYQDLLDADDLGLLYQESFHKTENNYWGRCPDEKDIEKFNKIVKEIALKYDFKLYQTYNLITCYIINFDNEKFEISLKKITNGFVLTINNNDSFIFDSIEEDENDIKMFIEEAIKKYVETKNAQDLGLLYQESARWKKRVHAPAEEFVPLNSKLVKMYKDMFNDVSNKIKDEYTIRKVEIRGDEYGINMMIYLGDKTITFDFQNVVWIDYDAHEILLRISDKKGYRRSVFKIVDPYNDIYEVKKKILERIIEEIENQNAEDLGLFYNEKLEPRDNDINIRVKLDDDILDIYKTLFKKIIDDYKDTLSSENIFKYPEPAKNTLNCNTIGLHVILKRYKSLTFEISKEHQPLFYPRNFIKKLRGGTNDKYVLTTIKYDDQPWHVEMSGMIDKYHLNFDPYEDYNEIEKYIKDTIDESIELENAEDLGLMYQENTITTFESFKENDVVTYADEVFILPYSLKIEIDDFVKETAIKYNLSDKIYFDKDICNYEIVFGTKKNGLKFIFYSSKGYRYLTIRSLFQYKNFKFDSFEEDKEDIKMIIDESIKNYTEIRRFRFNVKEKFKYIKKYEVFKKI